MALRKYQYDALSQQDEIRLLHLEEAPTKLAPLLCHMSHARFESKPDFEALSYTWGGAVADAPLISNDAGDIISVTANCLAALLRLRHANRERMLWIDVICIDQDNVPERTQQVLLMTRIYRQARKVIFYLGDGTEETDEALDFISADAASMLGSGSRPSVGLGPGITSSRQSSAIDAMLDRPYFSRMWIIQELVFAQSVDVICGDRAVDWNSFSRTANYVDMNKKASKFRRLGYRPLPSVVYYRSNYRINEPSTLLQYLASEAPELQNVPELRPDYAKSVTETYMNIARYFIHRDNNLDVLRQVRGISSTTSSFSSDPRTPRAHGRAFDKVSTHGGVYPTGSADSTSVLKDRQEWSASLSHYPTSQPPHVAFLETVAGAIPDQYRASVQDILRGPSAAAWHTAVNDPAPAPIPSALAEVYNILFHRICHVRRFFLTAKGYMGLGSPETQKDDRVCVLLGGQTPFLIRGDPCECRLIGECFVRRLMNGEAFGDDGILGLQEFHVH